MNVFMLLFSGDHVFAIHYGSLYSCFHEILGHSFPHICHVVFACLTILQKQFFTHFEVFAEMLFLRCKLKRHQKCACVNCIYVRYIGGSNFKWYSSPDFIISITNEFENLHYYTSILK